MIFSLKTDVTFIVLIKVHDRKQSAVFQLKTNIHKTKHPPSPKNPQQKYTVERIHLAFNESWASLADCSVIILKMLSSLNSIHSYTL